MLLNDKSMKAKEIAEKMQKEIRPVNMHILGLIQMGYASAPEKGQYAITGKGKQALGIPEIDKEKALAIISYSPHDKAFHFYANIGKPLNLHAHNLRDFANKIQRADLESIDFHVKRGDFEAWFAGLGDVELSKKLALLKQKNLVGDEMRKQLHDIVEQRYVQLANMAGQIVPKEES